MRSQDIQSAIYTTPDNTSIDVTYINGKIKTVPPNENNRHYKELQEWDEIPGNDIQPYEAPPPPPIESNTEKMERINQLTVTEMRSVLGIVGGSPEG